MTRQHLPACNYFCLWLETRVDKLSKNMLQYKTKERVGSKMADNKTGKLFTKKSLQIDEAFGLVLRKKNKEYRRAD